MPLSSPLNHIAANHTSSQSPIVLVLRPCTRLSNGPLQTMHLCVYAPALLQTRACMCPPDAHSKPCACTRRSRSHCYLRGYAPAYSKPALAQARPTPTPNLALVHPGRARTLRSARACTHLLQTRACTSLSNASSTLCTCTRLPALALYNPHTHTPTYSKPLPERARPRPTPHPAPAHARPHTHSTTRTRTRTHPPTPTALARAHPQLHSPLSLPHVCAYPHSLPCAGNSAHSHTLRALAPTHTLWTLMPGRCCAM